MSVLARGERTYDEVDLASRKRNHDECDLASRNQSHDEYDLASGNQSHDEFDVARDDHDDFDLARGERTYEEVDLALETGLDSLGDDETTRESKRTPVVRIVEYSPYPRSDASEHLATGFTANESRGGLCILTREAHAVGAPLRIAVRELDGSARLEAIARVAWCNPEAGDRVAVGLEFLEVRSRGTRPRRKGAKLSLTAQMRTRA